MPVTTRSKSKRCLSSIPNDVELHLPKTSYPQKLVGSPKPRQPNRLLNQRRKKRPKKPLLPGPKPKQESSKYHCQKKDELSSTNTDFSSPSLPPNTFTHFFCQKCNCQQGVFTSLVDSCTNCMHQFDDHHDMENPWNPVCDYLCERQDLVTSIMQRLLNTRVVVIRATPFVGKTVLLMLLGYHILQEYRDLEPVFIEWETRTNRNNLPFEEYLESEASKWKSKNAKFRRFRNPAARKVFLIDEGQNSYEEQQFWHQSLKNHSTSSQSLFVLVCLYGISGISAAHEPGIASQALLVDLFQRVELRPSANNNLHILFTPKETSIMVMKWATVQNFQLENGMFEYLHATTDGHPGVLDTILAYLKLRFTNLPDSIRRTRSWSPQLCRGLIAEDSGFISELNIWGRGFWTFRSELQVKKYLGHPLYSHIPFFRVKAALRKVAELLHGYNLPDGESSDAFTFCYKMGLLHTEQPYPGRQDVTYTFASPIHRRYAYHRLFPGPEPGTRLDKMTLRQACLNVIERFSPSVLQVRSPKSQSSWGIPEAAFQNEIYCCFSHELNNIEILSEYSYTKDGRIDFYVLDKRWGIEILQSGNKNKMEEHLGRFRIGGKYHGWGILEDYIVLNFCPKSTVQALEIKDPDIQSHILQIAINSNEYTAEVYTYDNKLQTTLHLSKGRQRSHDADCDWDSDESDVYTALCDSKKLEKEAKQRMQELEQEKQEMQQEMEQKIFQLQLQLNQR
ncbi:8267c12d-1877-4d11-af0e-a3ad6f1ef536 [Sclerotinia trifoliorum]|uniref:8267c12d-1877-4d11-af0e-a3ad6f1ef536 n=1 Tax=Sclerotinia trifoliorum TaxID=28548 RepID=A0A8H2VMH8_9HELO|nr:8267c12d-1877-4d11-af0e-a3ad6f1ef536 [Sclerotinia trifoliorum]